MTQLHGYQNANVNDDAENGTVCNVAHMTHLHGHKYAVDDYDAKNEILKERRFDDSPRNSTERVFCEGQRGSIFRLAMLGTRGISRFPDKRQYTATYCRL